MTITEKQTARAYAQGQLQDMRDAYEDEDKMQEEQENVLCIDVEVHKQVMLTVGGPTVYFNIVFQNGEAVRGQYIHTHASPQESHLTDDEVQMVVEFYNLEEAV